MLLEHVRTEVERGVKLNNNLRLAREERELQRTKNNKGKTDGDE